MAVLQHSGSHVCFTFDSGLTYISFRQTVEKPDEIRIPPRDRPVCTFLCMARIYR